MWTLLTGVIIGAVGGLIVGWQMQQPEFAKRWQAAVVAKVRSWIGLS